MNDELLIQNIKNAPDAGAAAGAWWAFALRKPEFDNGADDMPNIMAKLLARDLADSNPQNESALEVFAGKLAAKVNEALAHAGDWGISLSVDYHPDMMLREAAAEANLTIFEMGWPWKTHMWVKPDSVSVSAGYRAPNEVIWSKQEVEV